MLSRLRKTAAIEIPADLWTQVWDTLPFLHRFRADEQPLRELCGQLLATKVMSGAGGLELSAPVQLSVAMQACLPILKLGMPWYRGWKGIVVYPSEFVARRRVHDETGLVHEYDETAAGEAWEGGPVVVSWPNEAAEPGPHEAAYNVVIHEFAHKLDLLNGEADGVPSFDRRLHADVEPQRWQSVMQDAFQRLCAAVDLIELDIPASVDPESSQADAYYARLPLDPYAAQDEAEFFAVSSEAFFADPQRLYDALPEWYEQLTLFYRLDPLSAPMSASV